MTTTIAENSIAVNTEVVFAEQSTGSTEQTETEKILRLPSGKTYRIKELTGEDYFEFQRLMISATQSGKKPEGAVDALKALACKMFVIDDQPVTVSTFGSLSFHDTSYISSVLGELLPSSPADKTS